MIPTTFIGWLLLAAFAFVFGFAFAAGSFLFNRLFGGSPQVNG